MIDQIVVLAKTHKTSLIIIASIMFGSRDWNNIVSCVLVATVIGFAIVASCLAKASQMPLNFHGGSGMQWKDCGVANNHSFQCKYAMFLGLF